MTMFKPRIVFESISKMLHETQTRLEQGETVDLSVFEDKVREFCDALNEAPAEEATKFDQELKMLFDTLTKWSAIISERQQAIKEEMERLNHQINAHRAYIKNNSSK